MSNQPANDRPTYHLRPNLARVQRHLNETRSPERLLAHYTLERQLSDRLRYASREERRTVYTEVYSKLLASLPDHPQNCAARSGAVARVEAQLRTIGNHLPHGSAFLEI